MVLRQTIAIVIVRMGHRFCRAHFPRRRNDFIRVGALLVLFFGILPNVLYLGHWSLTGGQGHESINTQEEAQEHAAHCHLGPSTCSDSPGFSQTLLALDAATFSLPDNGFLPMKEVPQKFVSSFLNLRIEKPPRVA